MPSVRRLLVSDQPTVYHVTSRTALDGFPMGPDEKDQFLKVTKHFASIYFTEVLGYCVMDNHFHLLLRMLPAHDISDDQVVQRHTKAFGPRAVLSPGSVDTLREKWTSLSELMREIKQTFSRWFNEEHGRKGYFWNDRFHSVIVEKGRTLINCLAYIDLNPIRAGLVERPEDYEWCSMAAHARGNPDDFLNLDLGLPEWNVGDTAERVRFYREFLYRTGAMDSAKGAALKQRILQRAEDENFEYTQLDRLLLRTKHYSESAIMGTREFVANLARKLLGKDRKPKELDGLDGTFTLR